MILPQHVLKLVSPEDRKKMGKAGLTAQEAIAASEIKSERDLQKQIISLLRLKGIEPIVSRMDRKTSNNVGTPDILFAITGDWIGIPGFWTTRIYACGWEVKMPGKKLEPHQEAFAKLMRKSPNHWRHRVITSVAMALKELNDMGIE